MEKKLTPFRLLSESQIMADPERPGAVYSLAHRKHSYALMEEADQLCRKIGVGKSARLLGIAEKTLANYRLLKRQWAKLPRQGRGAPRQAFVKHKRKYE